MTKNRLERNGTSQAAGRYLVRKTVFAKFDPRLVGLPNLTQQKKTFEGLAVILDLKDFTGFCDQRDPQHEVPQFLSRFLIWLFRQMREELVEEDRGNEVALLCPLPIFGKFLGDGVLLIWDVTKVSTEARANLIKAFDIVCSDYVTKFLRTNKNDFTHPPSQLRCGIAQGQVTAIAGGKDYVGLSINIASRLQKLADGAFSFGFTRKGLGVKEDAEWFRHFTRIEIPIRGVAKTESIYVLKREFRVLPRERQQQLRPRSRI